MELRPIVCLVSFLVVVGLNGSAASAQTAAASEGTEAFAGRWRDLALTRNCEEGFQRFMRMAQSGELGDDVTNANIGIFKNHARVELVRAGAASIVLFLTPRQSTGSHSQYFSIEPGPNATADDVERVRRALDGAFEENPFELAYDFFNAFPGGDPIPGLGGAYASGGWRGAVRVLARHAVSLASLTYTIVVLVLLATGLMANLLLLWGASPPR